MGEADGAVNAAGKPYSELDMILPAIAARVGNKLAETQIE
jgi:hypothetical protein